MKHLFTYFLGAMLLLPMGTNAQVVDTTKRINTWKLMHNYSRFEDVEMDTTTFDLFTCYNPALRNGTFYEHTGIIAHAAQNLDFFERPAMTDFLFGYSLNPYIFNPDRTVFFNTRSPYSEIIYSNMIGVQWNEETVNFIHTQNIDPFTNFGVNLELLSGKGLYTNEESRMSKFTLFASRAKEKYSAFGSFHYNNATNLENGGLKDIDAFRKDNSGQDAIVYSVNIPEAKSGYRNLSLFYTQKLLLLEKVSETDSTGKVSTSGRNLALNHQIQAERSMRYFTDDPVQENIDSFYGNFYYISEEISSLDEVKDSAIQDRITNTFQVILGDPYTDRLSARIYAGHEFGSYGQLSPEISSYYSGVDTLSQNPLLLDSVFRDTTLAIFNRENFNELFVGFHIAGPPESKWYWFIDGKYYLAGYYRNNFDVMATFARSISNSLRLGLRGRIRNKNVSYFHNNYGSAYFSWQNDFSASQIIRGEAFLESTDGRLDAMVRTGLLTNYFYWDEQALPQVHAELLYLLSAKIGSHLQSGGFHTVNQLLMQYTTAPKVLNLPLAVIRTSNYYQREFFNGALIGETGFNLQISSKYRPSGYMPATGVFYLQNDKFRGGYPFLDVFLGIRIKRTRVFGSLNNVLSPVLGNKYFSTYSYPGKPLYFRFALAWTFYD